jgi:regulator of Ty1 transposition protein 103
MSSFSVATLQEKLSRLSASQESIETLSLWIIHHKAFATTSVTVWATSFTSSDADHRLVLLYLANDILQNSRRKGAEMFGELFREPLQQVVPQICGQKIQSSVERMLRIWRERKVYDKAFVKQLDQLLSGSQPEEEEAAETAVSVTTPTPTPPPEPVPDFKLSLLEDAVQELSKFHGEMRVKEASVDSLPMDVWDSSSLSLLKDKSEGHEFSRNFDKAGATLKDYSDCLGIEVNERVNLSNMLASCLVKQARQLEKVHKDLKVYKTLMAQLNGCREKLTARQKDLERAQQTATSDPTCKEDLTEVGDMEIDSDEDAMDTVTPPLPSAPLVPTPPQLFTPPGSVTTGVVLSSSAPVAASSVFQPTNSAPPLFSSPPIVSPAPALMNTSNALIGQGMMVNTQPIDVPFSQPYLMKFPPPMSRLPQRFSRPPFLPPSGVHMSPRQQGILETPPTVIPPRYPFGGPRQVGPPTLHGNVGPLRLRMMVPDSMSQPSSLGPNALPVGMEGVGHMGHKNQITHGESQPPLQGEEEVEPKSSLDDRLQSLVGRKSLGSVLLQEYAESEESGDRPYTPTTTPLLPSPGGAGGAGDQDDESVTTPTPQLDMSPTTPEESGPPKFNPANPIMKALYRSPTRSPEEPAQAESLGVASNGPPTVVKEKGLLLGVDTGMLQNILKNVQGLKSPLATSPSISSPSLTKPEAEKAPVDAPSQLSLSSAPSAAISVEKPAAATTTVSPASNIKITSSLTSLLDEIFPQLSKSLQERKRKQDAVPESATKQPKLETPQIQTVGSDGSPLPRRPPPPGSVRPNGPRPPNGGFTPRPPMRMLGPGGTGRPPDMMMRPPRPPLDGGGRPPDMMMRPPRPPLDGGGRPPGLMMMRPHGPPFDSPFRARGPPRLDGGFRPLGPLRPGERLMGSRGPFGPRNPNSGPPPCQPFPPHSSFQPRMPPLSNQNFPRPPFRPGGLPHPPRPMGGNPGMEPNHFPAKPPQSHDSLQSIPPPGTGIWP